MKALLKASKEVKCNNLFIVTGDYKSEEKIKGKKIIDIPLFEWLLEKNIQLKQVNSIFIK